MEINYSEEETLFFEKKMTGQRIIAVGIDLTDDISRQFDISPDVTKEVSRAHSVCI